MHWIFACWGTSGCFFVAALYWLTSRYVVWWFLLVKRPGSLKSGASWCTNLHFYRLLMVPDEWFMVWLIIILVNDLTLMTIIPLMPHVSPLLLYIPRQPIDLRWLKFKNVEYKTGVFPVPTVPLGHFFSPIPSWPLMSSCWQKLVKVSRNLTIGYEIWINNV